MQRRPDGLRKTAARSVIRRDRVDRTGQSVVLDRKHVQRSQIVDVNPGNELTPRSERTPRKPSKRRRHARQRPAFAEYDSGAQLKGANTELPGGTRGLFPLAAYARQEIVARRGGLTQRFVCAIPVVSGRGGTDEHLRPSRK